MTLKDETEDPAKEFDDIKLRLDGIKDLPQGAEPIEFIRISVHTAALMLTVASPRASEAAISPPGPVMADTHPQRPQSRRRPVNGPPWSSMVPPSAAQQASALSVQMSLAAAQRWHLRSDARVLWGPGFIGWTGSPP